MAGFPETPVTLLKRLEERQGGIPNQSAWKSFFDLYHGPIRLAVVGAFRRCKWYDIPEDLVEEAIADVVVSFFRADFRYDPAKGRFRNYISQLAGWRVKDIIGKRAPGMLPLESVVEEETYPEPNDALLCQERQEYRASLLATLLEDVRARVSPQTFLIFEMTKIQEQNPEEVARMFKVTRNVVDNAVYRVLNKLRELAAQPEYRKEYFA